MLFVFLLKLFQLWPLGAGSCVPLTYPHRRVYVFSTPLLSGARRWVWKSETSSHMVTVFCLVMRTFKFYSLSNFQIYTTVLVSIVTIVYIISPALITYLFYNWEFIPFDVPHHCVCVCVCLYVSVCVCMWVYVCLPLFSGIGLLGSSCPIFFPLNVY